MPEIKHTFSAGKMNKDLDERLVPNGQYRHAMNIEVSTSEGSNVGAVQNILGNTNVLARSGFSPGFTNPKCVGVIADEANNCFYWFVKADNKDSILKHSNGTTTWIFVDVDKNTLKFDSNVITGINIIDELLFWTDNVNEPKKINMTLCEIGTDQSGVSQTKVHNPLTNTVLPAGFSDSSTLMTEEYITVIKPAPKNAPEIDIINIDNFNVPGIIANKKFSDSNNVLWGPGSYPDSTSTNPNTGNVDININILNSSSTLPYSTSANQTIILLKSVDLEDVGFDDPGGNNFIDSLKENFNQEYSYLPDYDIRLLITTNPSGFSNDPDGVNALSGNIDVHAEILSIRPNTTTQSSMWVVNFEQATDPLFENVFPRFAYRYRYSDKEYSPISPFTTVAFSPYVYSYDQTQGYNLAMKNHVKQVDVKNYITPDMRNDIIGIDILYKESNSPNVYIVEEIGPASGPTIYPTYPIASPEGTYSITSDTIYKLLPENQLLRPYDNVPKKALAQEVVGNRIVYGNYVQNFNLNFQQVLDISVNYSNYGGVSVDEIGSRSLKTLRDYQIGVVWEDEYGRQTPIQTNESATVQIPIVESSNSLQLQASINSAAPTGASYFKFFIKEPSSEYYNLALDRWYDARDGNLWLSFNSVDRNKVDEETYLYLKKGNDSDNAVINPNKYKILSIANEAPEYIKMDRVVMGELVHNSNDDDVLFFDETYLPLKDKVEFRLKKENVENSGLNGIDSLNLNEFTLIFKDISNNVTSKRYEIHNVFLDETRDDSYLFSIVGSFGNDINFIEDSTSTASSPVIKNGISIEVTKGSPKNNPEFDGKFFVKILKDFSISRFLINSSSAEDLSIVHQEPLFYYTQGNLQNRFTLQGGNDFDIDGGAPFTSGNMLYTDAFYAGKQVFGDGTTQDTASDDGPKWFIDHLRHEGEYDAPSIPGDYMTTQSTPGVNEAIDGDKIYISYGGIDVPYPDPNNPWQSVGNDHLWWVVGKASNPKTHREHDMVENLVPGKKFSWASDPNGEVYTIKNVEIKNLYNYTDGYQALSPGTDPSKFPAIPGVQSEEGFLHPANRRKTWILTLDKPISGFDPLSVANRTTSTSINFLDTAPNIGDKSVDRAKNPAVFETKPKDKVDIDIYHEASNSIPIDIGGPGTGAVSGVALFVDSNGVTQGGNSYGLSSGVISTNIPNSTGVGLTIDITTIGFSGEIINFTVNNGGSGWKVGDGFTIGTSGGAIGVVTNITPVTNIGATIDLDWFNCYVFGNGVESNRIQDDFNAPFIDNGPKVSTVFDGTYEEERLKNGLIYSGLYNSLSSVNRTNQFISAEKITKNINPTYGSIQKLYTRDSDLVTFCEDKVIKIYANKDALFNADGNMQLVATEKVLGQTVPFAGDYGISKNPESFAKQNYRAYFADKQRGAVLRLSMDGLTPISEYGMSDWFKDNLKDATSVIGTIDSKKDHYNLTIKNNISSDYTLTFSDKVNGWESFKSFIPEAGVSVSNSYYTILSGMPWLHHDGNRNIFYGGAYVNSSVNVILNDEFSIVKNFKTISYEGTQSQIVQNRDPRDTDYYNLNQKAGWFANITTDLEYGKIDDFIKKESKWFNYIKGEDSSIIHTSTTSNDGIDTGEFLFQGLGRAFDVGGAAPPVYTFTLRDIPDAD